MIANSNLAKPRSASQPGRGKVNKKIGLDTFVEEQESKRILPTTDAEKAIARLVFVFYADRSRRAIPAILVDAGSQTLIITAGPATLVPDGTPAARDRTFVEIPGRPSLDARYQNESTKDLFVFRTNNRLSEYRPAVRVKLEVGDNLSAILPGGSTELFITPKAARIVALNREADLKLPKHKIEHHYEKLVVINRSLPEGTPLFKDGKLAGLTLLGSRFLGEKANKSYVIPVERIVAFFQEIKPVSGTDISTIQPAKSQPKTTQAIPAKGKTATPFESPLNTIGKD